MATDFYELLGVSPSASQDEIKRSYRRLARELHPDANPDDPTAEARFKEVAHAYEVLSDPERRANYDRFGADGPGAGSDPFAGAGLGDIFEAFFGGSFGGAQGRPGTPAGTNLEVVLDVDFETAVLGGQEPVEVRTAVACGECGGSGAEPGTDPESCPECGGTGQTRRVRQSLLGQMVSTSPCRTCGGFGKVIPSPCQVCDGEGRTLEDKTYTIDVPAGVDSGSTLRLSGRGAAGPRGGGYGDLYVQIRVRPHDRFTRSGDDLVDEVHVSYPQVALGTQLDYETLDGAEELTIPPGTQPGRIFRLRGRGVPELHGRGRGDLLVRVVVDTPTKLSDEEEELIRSLAELRGDDVNPKSTSWLGRVRSAFS